MNEGPWPHPSPTESESWGRVVSVDLLPLQAPSPVILMVTRSGNHWPASQLILEAKLVGVILAAGREGRAARETMWRLLPREGWSPSGPSLSTLGLLKALGFVKHSRNKGIEVWALASGFFQLSRAPVAQVASRMLSDVKRCQHP